MALEIQKQIGTSRGITSEGYVRIESFEFRKSIIFNISQCACI